MVLGPLIGGGVSLIGAILDSKEKKAARDLQFMSLMETKRANRQGEQLARATKRDALGNKMEYIAGVGWVPELTALTESILGEEQKENLAQLTEDMPRERAARRRRDVRSQGADTEFQRAFNDYKYRPQHTEAESVGDATTTLLNARKKGLNEAGGTLGRQLLRTGGGSGLEGLYRNVGNQYADSLEDAILKGKMLGKESHRTAQDAEERSLQSRLGFLRGVADDTATTQPRQSTTNRDLSTRMDSAQQSLLRAIESARGASQTGYRDLAEAQGRTSLDLSGLAQALGKMDFSAFGKDKDEEEIGPYDFPPAPPDPTYSPW
jgi:hypothetical protein